MEMMIQRSTSASRGQFYSRIVDSDIRRINDFVILPVLEDSILMDAGRMSKCITSDYSLVRLHRHTHEGGDSMGSLMKMSSLYIGINRDILAALYSHYDLFHCSISCPFADTVHGNFHLSCSVQDTGNGICRSHSEVIVTMGRDDSLIDVRHVVHKIFYLGTILRRQTVACGIGDIHHRSTCLDDRFYDSRKVFIVCAARILRIKFHIINEPAGIFHRSHSTLENFFLIGIEFIFYMVI